MSLVMPDRFFNNFTNRWMGNQVVNVTAQVERPCPVVPPVFVSYVYGAAPGWNAVLVGLLSSLLALIFLLTCLYVLAFRRRQFKDVSDSPSSTLHVDKAAAAAIPVTCSSQTATTTFINEPGKETKVSLFSEQVTGPVPAGELVPGMTSIGNGHPTPTHSNGILANGHTDPSELHLLQHEHH